MYNATLIAVSGLDASGKSTQVELIKQYLTDKNLKFEYVHFPKYGDNEASIVISSYLRGEYGDVKKVDPVFIANMYAMDRFLYLPTLNKQLAENDVLLLDRYVFCNMAFQGAKYNTSIQSSIIREWIDEFEFGFLELPYPDLNIFFDVPIDIIKERLQHRSENESHLKDIHEADIEFQSRVRDNYLALKTYDNFEVVDCARRISAEESNIENLKTYTPTELFDEYKYLLDKTLLIR